MTSSKVLFFFSVIVIADILTSLAFSLRLPFWNIGFIIKTPIEFIFLFNYLRIRKLNFVLVGILILGLIWLLGITGTLLQHNRIQFSKINSLLVEDNPNILLQSFIVYNRYIFFLIIAPVLIRYKDETKFINGCKKIFEYFLVINSLTIIIGYIFNIQIFSSYNPTAVDENLRFGYKGLLYGINEVTGVYFLGIAYWYREVFNFKERKKIIPLLITVAAAFLTGAKGSILAFVLVTILYLVLYQKTLFALVAVPVIIKGMTYITTDSVEKVKNLANINLADSSIITFLLTGRDLYVIKNSEYIATNWNFLNYIFGDGILYSETDLIDLYYFFGVGAVFYLFFYFYIIKTINNNPITRYTIWLLILIAFTGGHIIRSGVIPVFLCLYLVTGNIAIDLNNTENEFEPKVLI